MNDCIKVDVIVLTEAVNMSVSEVNGVAEHTYPAGYGLMLNTDIGKMFESQFTQDQYRVEQLPRWWFTRDGFFVEQVYQDERGKYAVRNSVGGPLELLQKDGNWTPIERGTMYNYKFYCLWTDEYSEPGVWR
jgi:hypothetical protein